MNEERKKISKKREEGKRMKGREEEKTKKIDSKKLGMKQGTITI